MTTLTDFLETKPTTQLSLSTIKPNPLNNFEMIDMDDLRNSIYSYGVITPLTVFGPFEDGKYMLLAGERRWRCCRKLVEEEKLPEDYKVPVMIYASKNLNETVQKIVIRISNIENRDDTRKIERMAEVMELLGELVNNGEMEEREMARKASELFKVSDRWGRYWRRVFMSDDNELKAMVKDRTVNIHEASDILSMDEEKREQVKEEIKQNVPVKEAIRKQKDPLNIPKYEEAAIPESNELSLEGIENGRMFDVTQDELDTLDFDISDFQRESELQQGVDSVGRIKVINQESKREKEEQYKTKLDSIIAWCEKIKECENPTDEEWNVIEACREVADRFF